MADNPLRAEVMNRQLESQIALAAGGDLDETDEVAIERRAAVCPETRERCAEMRESLAALHACRDRAPVDETEESLWPAVASRLPTQRAPGPLESLRAWVPAITVASLLLAVATFATNPRTPRGGAPVAGSRDWMSGSSSIGAWDGGRPRPSLRAIDVSPALPPATVPLERFRRDERAPNPRLPLHDETRIIRLPDGGLMFVIPRSPGWE